jgi:hypothetical protein
MESWCDSFKVSLSNIFLPIIPRSLNILFEFVFSQNVFNVKKEKGEKGKYKKNKGSKEDSRNSQIENFNEILKSRVLNMNATRKKKF